MISITMFLLALDVSGVVIMHFIVEFVFWMMVGFLGDDVLDYWHNMGLDNWNSMVIVVMLVVVVVLWSGAGNSHESEEGDELKGR
jgi:hypothetical protein